ncbi:hypothetical protein [Viridibacillus arvi]|uniref:hypothetical protein n=1 Tax=Viridibacillus arvi TaxID=263475 RepID=UPI0034CF07DF
MEAKCIKDVVVAGRTVFKEGEKYDFEEVYTGKKVTEYQCRNQYGLGVWSAKDPLIKKHFKLKKDKKKKKKSILEIFNK